MFTELLFFHPTERNYMYDQNLESHLQFLHCPDHALLTYNGIYLLHDSVAFLFFMLYCNVKVNMFTKIMFIICCLSLNTSRGFYFLWQASYIVFLGFFSYALLTGFGNEVSWVEILMYVWVFCLMLDEVREVCLNLSCMIILFNQLLRW